MVCEKGASAIGLVFYSPSPRAVSLAEAKLVSRAVSPLVMRIGLFVDPDADYVKEVLRDVDIDCLQFHGQESADFCTQFGRPYIKAVSMRPSLDVEAQIRAHPDASAFLFDAWEEGKTGGTGKTFDWQRLPSLQVPWVLAGGLNPDNVGVAIEKTGAPAVDVSGGVEASPGVKDPALVSQFVAAVAATARFDLNSLKNRTTKE